MYRQLVCVLGIASFYLFSTAALANVCKRTPKVRLALEEQLKLPCEKIDSLALDSIQKLDLSNRGIKQLKRGDFVGLRSLGELNLFNNELSAIPADEFEYLRKNSPRLWKLSMCRNPLDAGVVRQLRREFPRAGIVDFDLSEYGEEQVQWCLEKKTQDASKILDDKNLSDNSVADLNRISVPKNYLPVTSYALDPNAVLSLLYSEDVSGSSYYRVTSEEGGTNDGVLVTVVGSGCRGFDS